MIEARRESIPRSRIRRTVLLAAVAILAFLLSRLLARAPGLVETLFVDGWARAAIPPLSRLAGAFPIPVIEVLALAYLGFRGWTAYRGGSETSRGERRARTVLASGLLVFARDLSIAVLLFYGLWGFNYARTPAAERLGLPMAEAIPAGEIQALAEELGTVANESYLALHGREDAGAPTQMPRDWAALYRGLDLGWSRAAAQLPVGTLMTARFGPPKPLLLSPLVAYLGLTGIYSPFTAEPLVVGTVPAVGLGLSMAHEAAHQRGITGEGEATLLGFVAAMNSGDPLLRYSAAVRGQNRLLFALSLRDSSAARTLAERRLPGVRRDLEDLAEYSRRHRGIPSRITSRVNDTYLRANRVPGGIRSYDRVTRLLVRLARARGGTFHSP